MNLAEARPRGQCMQRQAGECQAALHSTAATFPRLLACASMSGMGAGRLEQMDERRPSSTRRSISSDQDMPDSGPRPMGCGKGSACMGQRSEKRTQWSLPQRRKPGASISPKGHLGAGGRLLLQDVGLVAGGVPVGLKGGAKGGRRGCWEPYTPIPGTLSKFHHQGRLIGKSSFG